MICEIINLTKGFNLTLLQHATTQFKEKGASQSLCRKPEGEFTEATSSYYAAYERLHEKNKTKAFKMCTMYEDVRLFSSPNTIVPIYINKRRKHQLFFSKYIRKTKAGSGCTVAK